MLEERENKSHVTKLSHRSSFDVHLVRPACSSAQLSPTCTPPHPTPSINCLFSLAQIIHFLARSSQLQRINIWIVFAGEQSARDTAGIRCTNYFDGGNQWQTEEDQTAKPFCNCCLKTSHWWYIELLQGGGWQIWRGSLRQVLLLTPTRHSLTLSHS